MQRGSSPSPAQLPAVIRYVPQLSALLLPQLPREARSWSDDLHLSSCQLSSGMYHSCLHSYCRSCLEKHAAGQLTFTCPAASCHQVRTTAVCTATAAAALRSMQQGSSPSPAQLQAVIRHVTQLSSLNHSCLHSFCRSCLEKRNFFLHAQMIAVIRYNLPSCHQYGTVPQLS
jgi:RING-type zinc-finger